MRPGTAGMARATPSLRPFARERLPILIVLIVLAAACWAALLSRSAAMARGAMGRGALTMGLGWAPFMAVWVVMMMAMMLPTAAPMILTFAAAQAERRRRQRSGVPTWIFVAGYLLVWTALGIAAYALALGAEHLARRVGWIAANGARIGAASLIVAGLYQLSPAKRICLAKCRTPWGFILESWRDGIGGALRMGVVHGAYCAGCCWMLFVILFPLGVMNVAAMALVTALIYAERSSTIGARTCQVAAAVLITYGALGIAVPGVLPSVM
ncbi:MAG TPA: DUF2182 domain-containing protein [Gemmatimonadaceae bacterium]